MTKTDLTIYKTQLKGYLEIKGVEYNAKTKKWRCPNPGHADNDPSATLYDGERLNCNICPDKAWDIFEVAGLLEGLTDFSEKLKAVQSTLGMSPPKKKVDKKRKPAPKPVPLTLEKAREVFNTVALLEAVKTYKWLEGDVRFVKVWPYFNSEGLIELFDVRFENENNKKAVISFYWDGKNMRSKGAPVLLFNRNLIAADSDTPILIVEGAKTAEAAANIPGFISVTWNGGGKKCKQVDWTPLKNRQVYIYPDDDQKKYGEKHEKAGQLLPWHEQPGMSTAFDIKKILPYATIITPLEQARKIKSDGADIVEALEVMTGAELADYIKQAPELVLPGAKIPPSNPLDTPSETLEPEIFPFRVLGVADDGKGYFLDRHERLTAMALGSITQNKLLTLASLTFWQSEYAGGKNLSRDEWTAAIDSIIQIAGQIDFNPDRIRGRGAWRERDGRICYHNGSSTLGDMSTDRLYLRMTCKDIGLDSPPPKLEDLSAVLDVTGHLSFETRADMIRCIAWSTLAPFAGALPWRPAGLLTGRSESGKSTIVDMIIKPLSQPFVFSGGETTEAGVRQTIKNDAAPIVVEEAETDTPKKRQRRDDILSLMRQSTSDETPKAAKGTIDGKGMMFTLRSMFMFVAISPEVESIADDNRIFRVNLEKNDNDWASLKKKLGELLVPELCASVRALTWTKLPDIFVLAERMSPIIQNITGKSARYALAEAMLFASYQIVWKQAELTEKNLHEFFNQIYEWQPPEESRNEEDELLDLLLDHIIREGKDTFTLRHVLQRYNDGSKGYWKEVAGRYGLRLTPDGDLAIAKNFPAISNIIQRGMGYQRVFWRHPLLLDKNRSVSVAGKVRSCLIIRKEILSEAGDIF